MHILIVEDEKHLNDLLHDYLIDKYPNAKITQIFDGFVALKEITTQTYDLCLLDVMLPHINGFELLKKIKELHDVPVLMLSSLSDEESQLKGLEFKADDYITKPYSPKVVIKKIETILSRYQKDDQNELKTYGILAYDFTKYLLYVDNEAVTLNKKEWELLELFINHIGRVFTRDDLLNLIWGYDYEGYDRTVDTHIKRLRQKLGKASSYIETVFKTGYKFTK